MKILVLAPQPFYQERGTPIAVRLLLRALSERGDEVDLLTFAEGDHVDLPGLAIERIAPRPDFRPIKPGFSFKKVYCDLFLARKLSRMLAQKRYDVVHATEESVFFAQFECRRAGIPYVYDMDSSMSGQIADRFPWTRWLTPFFRRVEASAMRSARVVVPMCEALADLARRERVERLFVLKDVSLIPDDEVEMPVQTGETGVLDLRSSLSIGAGPLILYIGNLEPYQGIDLLLESFSIARASLPESTGVVLIGGSDRDVQKYRERVIELGLESQVHLIGPQPVGLVAPYMKQADLLVSPRTQGENTPMKVYTYLDSGVAVLATDLPTHRQVVDSSQSGLAPPEPEPFAAEMVRLLQSPSLREELAVEAKALIEREHSYPVFAKRVQHLYNWVEHGGVLTEPIEAEIPAPRMKV